MLISRAGADEGLPRWLPGMQLSPAVEQWSCGTTGAELGGRVVTVGE